MTKTDRTIRQVTEIDRNAWNRVVGHPLQSWEWGKFRENSGIDVVRLGVYEKEKLVDGWQLTFHRLPIFPFTIGYFPKGPAPTAEMVEALINIGHSHQAIFIQLEPNVILGHPESTQVSREISLKSSHHPLFTKFTFMLDLIKSEDELLASFQPKTRYNIKIAQKHGVTVKEDNSDEAFSGYLQLLWTTTSRQEFYAHNEQYHKAMWQALKGNVAHLFTATYQGNLLATWIVFSWKDTLYYPYGASSRGARNVMAPNLMLWETIKWGRNKGLKHYDLWGALGPNPDPHDPWYGFHRFKIGYNPALVEFIGSYDLVINPFVYKLYAFADDLRWIFLRLKAKFL